ncbi:hypothetical protein NDU88_004807 [Pleurodeles waltl]|uniref:Uncharacterized protein n=1 Tax=Pleurodeles waltl TaxID=8319 RepID=A0AAV7TV94_PLEWA|nr:hypothetical protein NDU88_004807 [Pleurodeles waltl]
MRISSSRPDSDGNRQKTEHRRRTCSLATSGWLTRSARYADSSEAREAVEGRVRSACTVHILRSTCTAWAARASMDATRVQCRV